MENHRLKKNVFFFNIDQSYTPQASSPDSMEPPEEGAETSWASYPQVCQVLVRVQVQVCTSAQLDQQGTVRNEHLTTPCNVLGGH